jgi:hypothetical protein
MFRYPTNNGEDPHHEYDRDFQPSITGEELTVVTRCNIPTQADIARVVKAVIAAGREVDRVEIDPNGRIIVVIRATQEVDELDSELKEFEAAHGQG